MRRLFLIAIFLVLAPLAHAHDLFLSPAAGGFELQRGHSAAAEHGDAAAPCDDCPAGVAAFMLDDGATQMRMPGDDWPFVAAPDHVAAAAVTVNWGVWARTSTGDLRREDLGDEVVLKLWRSSALAKTVTLWHDLLVMPLSDELEIAPTLNPFDVPVGDKLKIRVLLHRKPVADAVVCYDGKARGVTGRGGTINIRLRHDGLQILTATLRRPDPDGVLDEIVHETTLSFIKE